MVIARVVCWRWRIPCSISVHSQKGSGGAAAHAMDDGGPTPLRHICRGVCARLARVEQTLGLSYQPIGLTMF